MHFYYITFRSITFAQQGERLLQQAGIRCTLQRTPRWMEQQGCGYCLRLWTEEPERSWKLLRENRVPVRKLYVQRQDGQLEELHL